MRQYKVTVDGVVFNVAVEPCDGGFKTSFAAPLKTESAVKKETVSESAAPVVSASPAPAASGSGEITAPMPGTVLDVRVKEGDSVKVGDVVMILEAMKMEIEVTSTANGVVKSIAAAKGSTVSTGDVVVTIG